jgi:hypothetical protein
MPRIGHLLPEESRLLERILGVSLDTGLETALVVQAIDYFVGLRRGISRGNDPPKGHQAESRGQPAA